jgi:sugar phosphate isomerase/epimerase
LTAMKKFIKLLAPMLKDLGLRINLETHGDETSFELLRIIEEIGPDIVGVTLDPGNLPLSGDVPMSAIKRLAPYVHCTHCKDGVLYKTNEGIVQQIRTVGQGVVDWEAAIEVLGKHNPGLHLSMEDYRAENLIRFYDPVWRKYFPDLTDNDIKAFEGLADDCNEKINQGRLLGIEEFKKLPWTNNDRLNSYKEGASYLRKIINKKNMGRQ